MSLIEIILLGIALGIDCLVVSFCQGLIFTENRVRNSLALSSTMGAFQGFMPVIGFFAASVVVNFVQPYSKWIVFTIFILLGIKFIYEAIADKTECPICNINIRCLFAMGLATSIDALGSGVTLKLTSANLILSVLIIGLSSFLMSLIGFWIGNKFKNLPATYLEIFGGLILIGLAIKAIL